VAWSVMLYEGSGRTRGFASSSSLVLSSVSPVLMKSSGMSSIIVNGALIGPVACFFSYRFIITNGALIGPVACFFSFRSIIANGALIGSVALFFISRAFSSRRGRNNNQMITTSTPRNARKVRRVMPRINSLPKCTTSFITAISPITAPTPKIVTKASAQTKVSCADSDGFDVPRSIALNSVPQRVQYLKPPETALPHDEQYIRLTSLRQYDTVVDRVSRVRREILRFPPLESTRWNRKLH